MKRKLKLKPVRLPKCPVITDIRAGFTAYAVAIRAARMEYTVACVKASLDLHGLAFARFITKAAEKMIANGLYSSHPTVGFTAFCLAYQFSRVEVGADYWKRQRWWDYRGLTIEMRREWKSKRYAKYNPVRPMTA